MNRQAVTKAQKPNNSDSLQTTDISQRKTINRTDFGASTVDTWGLSEQRINGSDLSGAESCFCYDFSTIPVTLNSSYPIQAKLKIGQPNDKYEQEADRVAEQVMRMPESRLSSSSSDSALANNTNPRNARIQHVCAPCSEEYKTAENENRPVEPEDLRPKCRTRQEGLIQTRQITPLIQRQESLEEEEDDKELIQTKQAGDVTLEVTPAISSGIQSLQGGGRPLSGSERSFFEPRFGADFSNVRVHNDARAASLARSVNARAFTLGHNVVFGAGEYSPDASSGRKLSAHELTHVVQQNGGASLFSVGKNSENTIPNFQELSIMSPEFQQQAKIEGTAHEAEGEEKWPLGWYRQYARDKQAIEIFKHWVEGQGGELILKNEEWRTYMMKNKLLEAQLIKKLVDDALQRKRMLEMSGVRGVRILSGDLGVLRFSAVIENGYRTGYELLHGTNKDVGGFEIRGSFLVRRHGQLLNITSVHYEMECTWNDKADPLSGHFSDEMATMFFRFFSDYHPKDYILRIKWKASAEINIGKGNLWGGILKEGKEGEMGEYRIAQ